MRDKYISLSRWQIEYLQINKGRFDEDSKTYKAIEELIEDSGAEIFCGEPMSEVSASLWYRTKAAIEQAIDSEIPEEYTWVL